MFCAWGLGLQQEVTEEYIWPSDMTAPAPVGDREDLTLHGSKRNSSRRGRRQRRERREKGSWRRGKRKCGGKARKMAGAGVWCQAPGLVSRLAGSLGMGPRAPAQGSCHDDSQTSVSRGVSGEARAPRGPSAEQPGLGRVPRGCRLQAPITGGRAPSGLPRGVLRSLWTLS